MDYEFRIKLLETELMGNRDAGQSHILLFRTLHAPVASLAESPDRTGLHARRPHRPAGRCLPPCTFAESSPRQAGLRWTRLVFIQRPIHRVNCARLSPVIFARKRRTIPFWPRLIRRYCWARPALEMTRRLRLFAHWIILTVSEIQELV